MGHWGPKQNHQFVALRTHIYFVDYTVVTVNHLLGPPKIGIQNRYRLGWIIRWGFNQLIEIADIGEKHADRAKFTNLHRGSI